VSSQLFERTPVGTGIIRGRTEDKRYHAGWNLAAVPTLKACRVQLQCCKSKNQNTPAEVALRTAKAIKDPDGNSARPQNFYTSLDFDGHKRVRRRPLASLSATN